MLYPLVNRLSLLDLTHKYTIILMENFYTYRSDYDNDDFVPHRNSMWKWLLACIYEFIYAIYYIMHVFWYVSTDDACIYAFALCLLC